MLLIPFLVIAVQGGEIAAAWVERRVGRRPIAADLSPRTWEAAGIGVAAAAADRPRAWPGSPPSARSARR